MSLQRCEPQREIPATTTATQRKMREFTRGAKQELPIRLTEMLTHNCCMNPRFGGASTGTSATGGSGACLLI